MYGIAHSTVMVDEHKNDVYTQFVRVIEMSVCAFLLSSFKVGFRLDEWAYMTLSHLPIL